MAQPTLSIRANDRVFIDGNWTAPHGKEKLSVISPVTEETLMLFPDGTPENMDRAVASARAAFDSGPWPRMSAQERGEMLLKVAAVLQRRLPEIANAWTAQVGAPISLTKYASTQAPGLFEFYGKMIQTYPIVDERKRDEARSLFSVAEGLRICRKGISSSPGVRGCGHAHDDRAGRDLRTCRVVHQL